MDGVDMTIKFSFPILNVDETILFSNFCILYKNAKNIKEIIELMDGACKPPEAYMVETKNIAILAKSEIDKLIEDINVSDYCSVVDFFKFIKCLNEINILVYEAWDDLCHFDYRQKEYIFPVMKKYQYFLK